MPQSQSIDTQGAYMPIPAAARMPTLNARHCEASLPRGVRCRQACEQLSEAALTREHTISGIETLEQQAEPARRKSPSLAYVTFS